MCSFQPPDSWGGLLWCLSWQPRGQSLVWLRGQVLSLLPARSFPFFPISWEERGPTGPHEHPFLLADDSGDESVSQTDKTELQSTLRTLSSKVEDLSTCNDLIAKHGTALQRSLSELETLRLPAESTEKIKQVNERATLFRITSNAMINVSPVPHPMGQVRGVPQGG